MRGKCREWVELSNPNLHFTSSSLSSEVKPLHHIQIPSWSCCSSQPSEPPDITNLFSSYDYQSPALNTEGEFQIFETGKSASDEEKVTSPEQTQSENKILSSSYSLSLPSEPPDVNIWFPSYIYESPVLDTEELKLIESEKSESEKENVDYEERNHSETKDDDSLRSKFVVSKFSDKIGETHDLALLKDTTKNLNNGNSRQMLDFGLFFAEDRTQSRAYQEDHPCKKKLINCVDSPLRDCSQKIRQKLLSAEVLGKRKAETKVLKKEVDYAVSKRDCERVNVTSPVDHGFISTKSRNVSGDCRTGLRNSQENHVACITNTGTILPSIGVHASVGRSPLSEITNSQCEVVVPEIAGKWRCPQKNKPVPGPPLKQLRLDRWMKKRLGGT